MSLEFIIIPINKLFLAPAYDIQTKIKIAAKINTYILVDTDFDIPFNKRINKWKKNEFNVISLDEEYNESNTVVVRLFDKGTRAQAMEIEELIQLIESFDDEEPNSETLNKNNNIVTNLDTNSNSNDNNCIIM